MATVRVALLVVGGAMIVACGAVSSYGIMQVTVGREATPKTAEVTLPPKTELVITEWSVTVPITTTIQDARYYASPTLGKDTMTITSARATELLGTVQGCREGLYGPSISRVASTEKVSGNKVYLQTAQYRFEAVTPTQSGCTPSNIPDELPAILTSLGAAVEKIHE